MNPSNPSPSAPLSHPPKTLEGAWKLFLEANWPKGFCCETHERMARVSFYMGAMSAWLIRNDAMFGENSTEETYRATCEVEFEKFIESEKKVIASITSCQN